jgi:hypothetical protein
MALRRRQRQLSLLTPIAAAIFRALVSDAALPPLMPLMERWRRQRQQWRRLRQMPIVEFSLTLQKKLLY